MKKVWAIKGGMASLLLLLVISVQAQLEIKVMSYNIRLDVASDGENRWEARKEKLTGLMRFYAPDFIGGQEVMHHQLLFIKKELRVLKISYFVIPKTFKMTFSCHRGQALLDDFLVYLLTTQNSLAKSACYGYASRFSLLVGLGFAQNVTVA